VIRCNVLLNYANPGKTILETRPILHCSHSQLNEFEISSLDFRNYTCYFLLFKLFFLLDIRKVIGVYLLLKGYMIVCSSPEVLVTQSNELQSYASTC